MERIQVIADDRECRGGVVEALPATGSFDVALQRLAVGDYKVDGRFLFERKTLPDLVFSIQSGRLFSQALRLAAVQDLRPARLLEHFGGVRAVLTAEEDELASVAGIGGQTARRIAWAVEEPRARYKLGLS